MKDLYQYILESRAAVRKMIREDQVELEDKLIQKHQDEVNTTDKLSGVTSSEKAKEAKYMDLLDKIKKCENPEIDLYIGTYEEPEYLGIYVKNPSDIYVNGFDEKKANGVFSEVATEICRSMEAAAEKRLSNGKDEIPGPYGSYDFNNMYIDGLEKHPWQLWWCGCEGIWLGTNPQSMFKVYGKGGSFYNELLANGWDGDEDNFAAQAPYTQSYGAYLDTVIKLAEAILEGLKPFAPGTYKAPVKEARDKWETGGLYKNWKEELLVPFSKINGSGKYGKYYCGDSYCGEVGKYSGGGAFMVFDFASCRNEKEPVIRVTSLATKRDLDNLKRFIEDYGLTSCKVLKGNYDQPNHKWTGLKEITL